MKKIASFSLLFLLAIIAYFYFRPKVLPPVHLKSGLPTQYGKMTINKADSYLIRDVSVIPMTKDTILAHHHVLIEKGRIKQVTPHLAQIDTAGHCLVIDGTGKFLIPGLNDLHVHLNDDNNLLLFVANGVTTIRNMAGYPFHLNLRKRINQGQILGPTLYTASPILEGTPNVWKFSHVVKTRDEARQAVIQFAKAGYDCIKIYHTLPQELYREILQVGDSLHIPVVGHIPFQVDLEEVLASTQYSLEHVDVSPLSPYIPLVKRLELIGHSQKWMCPTLLVYKNMQKHPNDPTIPTNYERYVDKITRTFWQQRLHYYSQDRYRLQKVMAKLIYKNGGRFIAGTDCLNPYVLAGFSIHEELQELVSVGLPAYEALKASTVNAAVFLKRDPEVGTIEADKQADLVLLSGNPLKDIANTKTITGVMLQGRWFSSAELKQMLAAVEKTYPNQDH
ncbi:amidohydrolase family protein [Spirosoma soli]|uniref:Amidohydrolase family protein n=1 Tax=Spirosoma soli TaxID=1770529 RepID=A0ABW5M5Z7_9BACT